MIVLIKSERLFGYARILVSIVPAWPNITFAINSKTLHTSRLGRFITGTPTTIRPVNFVVDTLHVSTYCRARNHIGIRRQSWTIMVTIPYHCSESGRIAHDERVFGYCRVGCSGSTGLSSGPDARHHIAIALWASRGIDTETGAAITQNIGNHVRYLVVYYTDCLGICPSFYDVTRRVFDF